MKRKSREENTFFEVVPNKYRLFKITPHQSVLNSTNRKLFTTLHQVFSMYDSPFSRLWREGKKIYYREKDSLWWIINITGAGSMEDPTPTQVEFYVAVSDVFAEVFLIKFNNHDQWNKSTIQEVDFNTIQIPDDSDLYRLKYTRSNMFSLSYDYTTQTVPIRELVNVSQEVNPGDYTSLMVRVETVSRKKWKSLIDYDWSVWNKGSVPQRNDLDPAKVLKQLIGVASRLLYETKSLVDDVIKGIEKSFFNSSDTTDTKEFKPPNPEREEILVNGDLSPQTKRKRNLPVFRSDLFVMVNSDTQEKKGMLTRSIASAFNELAGDNSLHPIKVNIKYGKDWTNLPKDRDSCMMSTEELGKVMQLPTKEVQQEYKENLESNQRTEIEIPPAFLDDKGILVGTAANKGQSYNIYLPTKDIDMLMTSRAFIGSPRVGKDQAAINLVVESKLKHGIGAVIPDVIDERNGHRGMADAIRDHLPPEDVIDLNLGDYDWPVYIGLDSITRNIKNQRIASNRIAQELTSFLMGDDIENHQTREYLREAAKITKGDLMGIKLLFMSQDYRQKLIVDAQKQGLDISIWMDFDKMSDGKQGQIYGPIITRLGELMGDEVLKPIFCQRPNPIVDLNKWMQEGKVVVYRIPSRDLGEMAVNTLTYWIILTVFLTKLAQGGQGAPTWLILNEPHQFLSKGLIHFCKRLLAEGPKYQVAPIFLFHHFKQLPSDFVDILLSSSLNWHIFKNTNDKVYERLEQYLMPTFEPETAMRGTQRFHYIASWLDARGEYQPPFMVKAPDLISKRYKSQDNSFITKRHSRIYGRSIGEVSKEIQARNKLIFTNKQESSKIK